MRVSKYTGYRGYHFIQKEINPMKYSALDVLLSFDRLDVGNIELETPARSNTQRQPVCEHRGVKLLNPFEATTEEI